MEVFYYESASGRSPVEEFVQGLPEHTRESFFESLRRLENNEVLSMPISKNLSSAHRGLHELRLKDTQGIYRIFYYIKVKDAIYLLHGFKKKTQKTPLKEFKIALKRLKEL